jgi:cupin fold WbuC family metalloprotein
MSSKLSTNFIKTNNHSICYFSTNKIIFINDELMRDLELQAKDSPLQRARICLHTTEKDTIQEMLIALTHKSIIFPHKHVNIYESFHIIKGFLVLFFYDNQGNVINEILMGPLGNKKKYPSIYRMNDNLWHSIIPVSKKVIYHEVSQGPFEKNNNIIPNWISENNYRKFVDTYLLQIKKNKRSCYS